MQLLKGPTNFDFMGKRYIALVFSLMMIALAAGSLATRHLNVGVDFTGGWLIEVGYPQPVDLAEVRGALGRAEVPDSKVQHFGSSKDVLIRIAPDKDADKATLSNQVLEILQESAPDVKMRRVEFVGPQVGEELANKGTMALLIALAGILMYVAVRFEFRFALGALVAVIHDVVVTIGVFSLFFWEFDLSVLAAVLAVIGYSLNDTIVVFDRIRENFRKIRKSDPVQVMNVSINQTLSRTLVTSLTTLLVLFALFYFGGEVIHNFALALIVGVLVGTYSSVYVASSVALLLGVSKKDLMPVKREGDGLEEQQP